MRPTAFQATLRLYATSYCLRVLQVGLGLFTFWLTARLLGPAGRGSLAMAVSTAGMLSQIALMGLPVATTSLLQRHPDFSRQLLGLNFFWALGGGLVLATLGILYNLGYQADPVVLITALSFPFYNLYVSGGHLLYALYRPVYCSLLEIAGRLLWTLLLVLALAGWFTLTPALAVLTFFVSQAPVIVGSWARLRPAGVPSQEDSVWRELVQASRSYSIRIWLASVLFGAMMNVDVLLVGSILSSREAGLYNVAMMFGNTLLILPQAVLPLLMTENARLPNYVQQRAHLLRRLPVLGLTMLGVAIVIALLSGPVIGRFLGPAFAPSIPLVRWIIAAATCIGLAQFLGVPLCVSGQPRGILLQQALLVLVNVAANLYALPRLGVTGAAIVLLVTGVLWLFSTVLSLWWYSFPEQDAGEKSLG